MPRTVCAGNAPGMTFRPPPPAPALPPFHRPFEDHLPRRSSSDGIDSFQLSADEVPSPLEKPSEAIQSSPEQHRDNDNEHNNNNNDYYDDDDDDNEDEDTANAERYFASSSPTSSPSPPPPSHGYLQRRGTGDGCHDNGSYDNASSDQRDASTKCKRSLRHPKYDSFSEKFL